jgi:plasmid stabilization system protein ParE
MSRNVVITPTAEANLDEIFRFIALDGPRAASRFIEALRRKIATLASMPERCPAASEDGLDGLEIRQIVHGNYRILFTIATNVVVGLQVRHSARLPVTEG